MRFTPAKLILLIGVIMAVLAAFGVGLGSVDLFELGVAVCFGSFLV